MYHVLESQQFDVTWLEGTFFPLAEQMAEVAKNGGNNDLHGRRMATFFFEPSTRTRMSFEVAMHMLGGRVVFSTENAQRFSSVAKGETLADTIEVVDQYFPDVIVLRHPDVGSAKIAADVSRRAHIINAGDGRGQHPTQALLDLFTIRMKFPNINGIQVAMVGDLKNGRTIRSLAYLLGKYDNVRIFFVAPPSLSVGDDIKEYLTRHRVGFSEVGDIHDIADCVHVIYQTRTQTERGGNMNGDGSRFRVDSSVLNLMALNSIIMHPMPINRSNLAETEIDPIVDNDPRAVYKRLQIGAGLSTRMALLKLLLS